MIIYNSTKKFNKLIFLTIFAIVLLFFGIFNNYTASANSSAKSMIVIESSTGRVLYEHNAYQKLPMASTTKIMTAITVIECASLDIELEIPKAACGIEGSSIYLEQGEKLTVRHLLYGLMLQSGNDCAVALAIYAGGSVESFAKMMNDKAQEIGAYDSNFVNPHGLHSNGHYTTSFDLAKISAYAMQNHTFREIVATKKIKIPWTTRNYDRVVVNKNKMLSNYKGATGIKTGFTKQAGRCLVSSAYRDGMELVCVVLNCGPMFEMSMQYMDKMFEKYHIQTILKPFTYWGEIPIDRRKDSSVGVYSKDAFLYPIADGEESLITSKLELPEKLSAPLSKDSEIGKIKIYYDNQLIFSTKIYTINSIGNMSLIDAIEKIIQEM